MKTKIGKVEALSIVCNHIDTDEAQSIVNEIVEDKITDIDNYLKEIDNFVGLCFAHVEEARKEIEMLLELSTRCKNKESSNLHHIVEKLDIDFDNLQDVFLNAEKSWKTCMGTFLKTSDAFKKHILIEN